MAELPYVMQDPRDSAVIVVRDGVDGPRLSLFGPELQTVTDSSSKELLDIPVSQSGIGVRDVVGAIDGERMWVSWTDDRSGEPQVYINAYVSRSRSWERAATGVDEEREEGIHVAPEQGLTIAGLTPTQRIERYGFALVVVTPNPVTAGAFCRIGSDEPRRLSLDQYDATGRHLGHTSLDVLPGIHDYPLPNVHTSGGVYYIAVSTSDHRESVPYAVFPE